jgi:pimeloyl-ACP methyl ester carboxylesterase
MLGIKSEWLTGHVLDKSAVIARFEPDSVRPVAAAASVRCPMLFIHGDADDKIPPAFNQRNYAAVQSSDKQWISVPGGTHHNVWRVGGEGLKEKVYAFLERLR